MHPSILPRRAVLLAAACLALPRQAAGQNPAAGAPLATFSAQKVVVVPVQFLRADTSGFVPAARWDAIRRELDDSIGNAIAERGVGRKWSYAADVARSARRNAAYTSDPYALGAHALRNAVLKRGDKMPEMLLANLRALIALGDARFTLVPVEAVVLRNGDQRRIGLRLALIDGRAGLLVWAGEVTSDAGAALTPAVVGSLAARVADLVVAP